MDHSLFSSMTADALKMQDTEIFVLGDLVLDLYIAGKVHRISPEAPVPVVLEDRRWSVLGGAANVAANAVAFGARAFLAGRIGGDKEGVEFLRLCTELGIDTDGLVRSPVPTTRKLRVLAGYQQIVRVDREEMTALTKDQEQQIAASFQKFLRQAKNAALVISDYGKGVCSEGLLRKVIDLANTHKIPLITDPKGIDLRRYQGTTVIKPNLNEGREILKHKHPGRRFQTSEEEIEVIMRSTLETASARNIVLSLSEHGVRALGQDAPEKIHFKTTALQVADVSGAGDTMIAFLAMGLGSGLSLKRSVQLSNIAAGIVCGKLGTATLTPSEFLATCHTLYGATISGGVLSRADVQDIASQLRASGRRIVFTNGCFDLLHTGHIEVLQKAKSFGDVLFVGLNADQSVKRLKGAQRPLQNEQDRAQILAALTCVDYVVIFDEDTPLNIINLIKPHVLVKGGDYEAEQIVGAREVRGWDGEVKIVPLIPGRSTTSLVQGS